MERRFYEPKPGDAVAVLPNQNYVSLSGLESAGIDVGSPFLVWADRTTSTVFARQSDEMRAQNPGRLFEGPQPITALPGEDPEDEYERDFDAGYERGHDAGVRDKKAPPA